MTGGHCHSLPIDEVLKSQGTSDRGLDKNEAQTRLEDNANSELSTDTGQTLSHSCIGLVVLDNARPRNEHRSGQP